MITTGTVLDDRYRLDEHLSRGGVGDVFSAQDLALHREVAVKVVRVSEADHPERFRTEARALARLNHPGIVSVHDVGEDPAPFIVMELVRGAVLSERIEAGPLPANEVSRIGQALATGLAYAHDQGVVHRDVKPANVLFDEHGAVHLADFGIARLADTTRLTETGMTVGTAAYLSPEQLSGETVTPSTDVYSLGLVLLEALTGELPFAEAGENALLARLHTDPEMPDDLPASWRDLLSRMLSRSPRERPSASRVASVLSDERAPSSALAPNRPREVARGEDRQRRDTRVLTEAQTPEGDSSPGERRWVRPVLAVAAAGILATVAAVSFADSSPSGGQAGDAAFGEAVADVSLSRDVGRSPRDPAIPRLADRTARRTVTDGSAEGTNPNSGEPAVSQDRPLDGAADGNGSGNARGRDDDPPGKAKGRGRGR